VDPKFRGRGGGYQNPQPWRKQTATRKEVQVRGVPENIIFDR